MAGVLPALGCSSTGDFEIWMKGTLGMGGSVSEEAQYGGPLGRAPLLGTLEDILRKAPDIGISLSIVAPLRSRGTWNQEGARLPGTGNDE